VNADRAPRLKLGVMPSPVPEVRYAAYDENQSIGQRVCVIAGRLRNV
jgi:hypothetical protein